MLSPPKIFLFSLPQEGRELLKLTTVIDVQAFRNSLDHIALCQNVEHIRSPAADVLLRFVAGITKRIDIKVAEHGILDRILIGLRELVIENFYHFRISALFHKHAIERSPG